MSTDRGLPAELAAVTAGEPGAVARLRAALLAAAGAEGLIDVAYRVVDSPLGALLLAGTDAGLMRVAFAREGHDSVLESLASTVSPRIFRIPARLDPAARELEEYFAGRRRLFDLPLDLRLAGGFRREVLVHLPEIGYGDTASYAAVAALTSSPRAVRAVGTACARNPLPLVLPCHRVVRSDGSLGGYLGGPEAKALLLDLEALPPR
ncbi:methylated-DNA--[protein]-cysteine S-methyltransferase [Arthrobacter dokdonensis]|uniref:methylated-DNA--[protein]-cysteine S-methyltransferase n=1 Tax=Arthrobacter dokdonellae TaxID=2211210 RepID=UPI000DE5A88F|nr:methylated-DNA--[protein]-cysteine S-methyltransferase [Arthrobacter dokdonellae]